MEQVYFSSLTLSPHMLNTRNTRKKTKKFVSMFVLAWFIQLDELWMLFCEIVKKCFLVVTPGRVADLEVHSQWASQQINKYMFRLCKMITAVWVICFLFYVHSSYEWQNNVCSTDDFILRRAKMTQGGHKFFQFLKIFSRLFQFRSYWSNDA